MGLPVLERIISLGDLTYYLALKDWERYCKQAVSYFDKYPTRNNYQFLNNVAWNVHLYSDDKDQLKKAPSWAKESVAISPEHHNTDIYAALLYKLEKYKEAKTWAKISIAIGTDNGGNTTMTDSLLIKINTALENE